MNVLIVDDSPVMRSFITRVLRATGLDPCEPIQAGNGQEALAALRSQGVDLVLCDINMPVMDGEQFLREARGDASISLPPVIVVSTDARLDRVRQMLDLGALGYVTKPFAPEVLRSEIERVMGVASA